MRYVRINKPRTLEQLYIVLLQRCHTPRNRPVVYNSLLTTMAHDTLRRRMGDLVSMGYIEELDPREQGFTDRNIKRPVCRTTSDGLRYLHSLGGQILE